MCAAKGMLPERLMTSFKGNSWVHNAKQQLLKKGNMGGHLDEEGLWVI
jgi:hypothetical protein